MKQLKFSVMTAVLIFAVSVNVQSVFAGAKEQILGKTWTDGYAFYNAQALKKGEKTRAFGAEGFVAKWDMLFFLGGTSHDAGDYIIARLNANGTMTSMDFDGNEYGAVEYKVIDGEEALFVPVHYGSSKTSILKPLKKGNGAGGLRDILVSQMVNYDLAGVYKDAKGKEYIFYPDATRAKGFSKTEYTFGEEYESPTNVIVFGKNEAYRYLGSECCDDELTLTPVKLDDTNDFWEEDTGKPFISLRKTKWTPPAFAADYPGKYPYASAQLLMRTDLQYFNKNQLKIMRNEIYARYGLKFKTKEMRDYFSKQDWYTPRFDDVTSKLTEREKLNIKLISEFEKDAEFEPMYEAAG